MKKIMVGVLLLTIGFSAHAVKKTITEGQAGSVYLASRTLTKPDQQRLQREIAREKRGVRESLLIQSAKKWRQAEVDRKQVGDFSKRDDVGVAVFFAAIAYPTAKEKEVNARRDLLENTKRLQMLGGDSSKHVVVQAAKEWYQAQEAHQQTHEQIGIGQAPSAGWNFFVVTPYLLMRHASAAIREKEAKKDLLSKTAQL